VRRRLDLTTREELGAAKVPNLQRAPTSTEPARNILQLDYFQCPAKQLKNLVVLRVEEARDPRHAALAFPFTIAVARDRQRY
jgi:hypothetical protein